MKQYKITHGNMNISKERAKMCYAFLKVKSLHIPEAGIYKKNPTEYQPGYVFPKDLFVKKYGFKEPIPTWKEFWAVYRKNRSGISCTASFDEEDSQRVGITLLPETRELPGNLQIIINIYSDYNDTTFLKELYDEYDKIA